MTLNQLQNFQSLARTQHYQHSAEQLGISQPALSRSISSLELELGATLFEKKGRNVVLSRFGRVFAEHIFTAMHEIDTGVAHVRDLTDPEKSVVEISLNYAAANIYLPSILRKYMDLKHKKELTFQFRQSNTPDILKDVREGISEIGFCAYMEDQPEIRYYPVVHAPLRLLAPLGHSLAAKSQVTLKEISQYPQIFSVDKTHYVENMMLTQGLQPIVACRMGEDRSIANLVACGFGLSVLPYDPQLEACGVALVPISDECAYREFYLAISRTRMLSSRARDFCSFVLKDAKKSGVQEQGTHIHL